MQNIWRQQSQLVLRRRRLECARSDAIPEKKLFEIAEFYSDVHGLSGLPTLSRRTGGEIVKSSR